MSSNTTTTEEVLRDIRVNAKAPKSQYNEFGHYHYRTKESILEVVKPLLDRHKALLEFKDSPVTVNDDVFMQSEARLTIAGDENVYRAFGYALHARELKGMQPAQVTGATTSYAQKAALEALFLIDSATSLDAMKPNITVTKEVARPAASVDPSTPVKAKGNWLNLGTKEYNEALSDLKSGKTTLDKIKQTYQVSKATEAKIIQEFK